MIELKAIKISIKESRKTIKKIKRRWTKLKSLLSLKKQKTIKDKIKSHKNFDKRANDQNKKLKVEGLDRKILYIQIKKQGLN
jgi:hypothetical protein